MPGFAWVASGSVSYAWVNSEQIVNAGSVRHMPAVAVLSRHLFAIVTGSSDLDESFEYTGS